MDKFLNDLLSSKSPTGDEFEAAKVVENYLEGTPAKVSRDVLGNRTAVFGGGSKTLMIAAHMDEIGFLVSYIDDGGFVFFQQLGGHDNIMLSGRSVSIITRSGKVVQGVTGKRAIHLMDAKERKEVPETYQVWIDIGASNRDEAEALVSVGDSVVYNTTPTLLANNNVSARAFDNRSGCYCAFKALRRIMDAKLSPEFKIACVATTQEEIGTRGAETSAYALKPDVALAIDVDHATDFPNCDRRKFGYERLGAGPVISCGPNLNPKVFNRLVDCAKSLRIPYQITAEPRPTGTDARVIQMSRGGVATGLVGIPLRYMHTPCEVANLDDIENCVKLVESFAMSLKNDDDFTF